MKSNKTEIKVLLDELLSVFYHKFIYYVPNEIIIEQVLEQLKDDIDDDFFDEFYFIDNYLGSSKFYNSDALELNILLADKRSFLEQNTFRLVEKSKEITEFEFLVIIEKYYEFLLLFIYITEWLSVNLKKYNGEDIHLSIIGAFGIQMQYFRSHLEDVCNYFGGFIDLEKEYDYSMKPFVMQYLPDILSRYAKIEDAQIAITTKVVNSNQKEKSDALDNSIRIPSEQKTKTKKQRPKLDDKEVEALILAKVFNVEEMIVNNKKN